MKTVTETDWLAKSPHRRFNPLKQEWYCVAEQDAAAMQGQTETTTAPAMLQYDPACYLCPGNERAGGARTDVYTDTYVFENDYAALKSDVPDETVDEGGKGLLVAEARVEFAG